METFSEFTQLKTSRHATPMPPKPVEPTPEERQLKAAASATDYFASMLGPRTTDSSKKEAPAPQRRTTVVTPNTIARVREEQAAEAFEIQRAALQAEIDHLKEELEIEQAVKDALAKDLAEARETAQTVQADLDALRAEVAKNEAENDEAFAEKDADLLRFRAQYDQAILERDAARAERDAVKTELAQEKEKSRKALPEVPTAPVAPLPTTASTATMGLLYPPVGLSEKFEGEIREHLLDTLSAAHSAAEASGRDRRARILEAILCTNPLSGELERRRTRVKQIVKDAGSTLDDTAIAELEQLGFRYISGNKHHKIEWAGIRFPLAKTPSDHRACLNSAAEINNRVF